MNIILIALKFVLICWFAASLYADDISTGKLVNSEVSQVLEDIFSEDETQEKMPTEAPIYLKIIKSRNRDFSTLIYRCRHVSAPSIVDVIEASSSAEGLVEVSKEQNMLTINDRNSYIEELKEVVFSLDRRAPQVLVEAQIIEVQMGDTYEWDPDMRLSYFDESTGSRSSVGSSLGEGLNFPGILPGGGPRDSPLQNGGWVDVLPTKAFSNGDVLSLNAKLRWLQSNNSAKILSSPNLIVNLGTTASVATGEDIPLLKTDSNNSSTSFSVYYKRTGVNLRVTPELINDDVVTLQVRPEVTSVVGTEILNSSTRAPVISVRNIDTNLSIKDGGVIMMGGLFSNKTIERYEEVPYLAAIPWLGELFKSEYTEDVVIQLIFLVKVTIVDDKQSRVFSDLDKTKNQVKEAGKVLQGMVKESYEEDQQERADRKRALKKQKEFTDEGDASHEEKK